MYAEARGHIVPDMLFYYTFGTFKIAVICQQIYARNRKGLHQGHKVSGFDKLVGELGRIAAGAIEEKVFDPMKLLSASIAVFLPVR